MCFDASIEGEGVLVVCTACILDAANLARIGRARIVKQLKAEAAAKTAEEAATAKRIKDSRMAAGIAT